MINWDKLAKWYEADLKLWEDIEAGKIVWDSATQQLIYMETMR